MEAARDEDDGAFWEHGGSHDDYIMVMLVACGLVRIRDNRLLLREETAGGRGTGTSALPAPLKNGHERLWWRFYLGGVQPPEDPLKVLALCRTPFYLWPVVPNLSDSDVEAVLLDGDELTPFAEDMGTILARDVEAELVQNQIFQQLMTVAHANTSGSGNERKRQTQDNYIQLRRFLIENPIPSYKDMRNLLKGFPASDHHRGLPLVQAWINMAYDHHAEPETLAVCTRCGNPLGPRDEICGTLGCHTQPERRDCGSLGGFFTQNRSARRFFHDPGLAELRIVSRLRSEVTGSVVVELWPELDSYDIRLQFFGAGEYDPTDVWGADVKDHNSPWVLARRFSWPQFPPCRRRFLVLPAHRMDPGYVRDLTAELDGRVDSVSVVSEDAFVAQAKKRSEEISDQ